MEDSFNDNHFLTQIFFFFMKNQSLKVASLSENVFSDRSLLIEPGVVPKKSPKRRLERILFKKNKSQMMKQRMERMLNVQYEANEKKSVI